MRLYKTLIIGAAAAAALQAAPALADKPVKSPAKVPDKTVSQNVLIKLSEAVKKIKLNEINSSSRPVSP